MTTRTTPSPLPTLNLTADRALIRHTGKSVRYLSVRVTAPAARRDVTRPSVHAAFCLDRSGSMAGRKLELAKVAVDTALGHLGANDRFALVAFDDVVEIVTPATPATPAAIGAARQMLRGIAARGSTALFEGWLSACGEIAASASADASAPVARCFLLTDGEANVGETDPAALAQHAHELYLRGVRTVTFGLGDGFNEELLQAMAAAGGGHFYFLEEAAQIADRFTSELGEALEVVSRDVRLVVRAPGVTCEPLTAYAVEAFDADRTVVRVGDLSADQVVELTFKLTFPDGAIGDSIEVLAQLFTDGRGPRLDDPRGDAPTHGAARFTFADHRANDSQPRERAIDRVVAEKYAAQAMRVAVAKNRDGDFEGARRELLGTAKKIDSYADGDALLLAMSAKLLSEADVYGAPMAEMSRKRAYAHATSHLKGRDDTGRARKS